MIQVPAEEDVVPTSGDEVLQLPWQDFCHRDDAHCEGSDGEDAELEDFGDDHAEHAALDDVKGGDSDKQEGVLIDAKVPGEESGGKLANAFEAVSEKSNDADEGVDDDDDVGELSATALAESRLNPFRAGHHIGTPQPGGEVNHQENLVEGRPKPGNPDAFDAIHKHPIDQQHSPADIKHSGSIRDAEDIPGHDVAAEEVGLHIARGTMRNPIADQDGECEVGNDDGNVNGMQMQGTPQFLRPAEQYDPFARSDCRGKNPFHKSERR